MSWTPERVDTAILLFKEGLSAAQIAKALGEITRNAVLGKLWRLGYARARPASPGKRHPSLKAEKVRTARSNIPPPSQPIDIPENRFDPLPGSAPRPWEDRRDGCSWPIGDGLSCCEPVTAYGLCVAHRAIGRAPVPPKRRDLERNLRWYLG